MFILLLGDNDCLLLLETKLVQKDKWGMYHILFFFKKVVHNFIVDLFNDGCNFMKIIIMRYHVGNLIF